MSEDAFSLSTRSETLLALPVGDALAESSEPECWHYGQVFFGKAKQAEQDGNSEAVKAWRLLGQISQIRIEESDTEEPFRPMFEGPNGRSMLPADLDDMTACAVRDLAAATEDAELRARLLDITWDRLRDAEAARSAVRAYMDSADRIFDPDHWIGYAERTLWLL